MKKRISNKRLLESLSGQDKKSLTEAHRNFLLIFTSIFAIAAMIIGISIPLILSDIHETRIRDRLQIAIDDIDSLSEQDKDTIKPENENLEWMSQIFICDIPASATDDGVVTFAEIDWIWGSPYFKDMLSKNPEWNCSLFKKSESADFSALFQTQRSGDRIILAGSDIRDFNNYFYPAVIALESMLIIAAVAMTFAAFGLSNLIFKPVIESMINQRKFIADASHELKTPLAVIKADCELLSKELSDDEKKLKWLQAMRDQTDRMASTIHDMVMLSSLESSLAIQKTINMSELVNDVALSFDAICFEKDIDYCLDHRDLNVQVKCDPESVRKMLEELLSNAVKYATGKPPKVDIFFTLEKGYALFTVTNTGCMIRQEEVARLFDRFYRTADMRAESKGGTGLGLSICRTICEKNNFTIWAEAQYGVQTTFKVKMPLA